MKCRVTRDLGACPEWQSPLIVVKNFRRVVAAGTIIDQEQHPETNVVALIKAGEAVPVDDEAREACKMTPAQIEAAQRAVQKMYTIQNEDDEAEEE